MYKKSFTLELVMNEGFFNELCNLYFEVNQDGLYDNFDEFIADTILFRINQHIRTNAEMQRDFVRFSKGLST